VRPGDRAKVPGFSSWAVWACREEAERSEQSFRLVYEVLPDWNGLDGLIRLSFADGSACQLPPEEHVLQGRPD
jgi:hypothetical protein